MESHPGKCLVYNAGPSGAAERNWEPLPKYKPEPLKTYIPDIVKTVKIRAANFPDKGAWEADVFSSKAVVSDRDRPYIPNMVMAAHQDSGFVFHTELIAPEKEAADALGETILDAILKHQISTAKIYFSNKRLMAALAPLGETLGIEFEHKKCLQSISSARRSLEAMTRNRGFVS